MSFLATFALALALAGGRDTPFRDLTFDQALESARKENKVVLVDFYTTWCPPCRQMDAQTWPQERIRDWVAKNAVAIRIDADREKELAKRYSVKAYPSMVFMRPDGSERDRLVGFVETGRFVSEADEIARGQGLVERARTSLVGHENDPARRESLGRALAARIRFDEALAEFTWCFDEGGKTPSYANARRTSLISEIMRLAEQYPAAAKMLEERRSIAEGAVLGVGATADDARDFAAINRARNEARRTTETFQRLEKEGRLSDEVKEALLDEVVSGWMAERQYALVVETVGDAEARVGKLVDAVEALRKEGPDARAREVNAFSTAMDKGGTFYEALLATGGTDAAGRIADRLLRMQPANTTYVALIERAVRAEAHDAARALVERAESTLTERERKLVHIAARKIPSKE